MCIRDSLIAGHRRLYLADRAGHSRSDPDRQPRRTRWRSSAAQTARQAAGDVPQRRFCPGHCVAHRAYISAARPLVAAGRDVYKRQGCTLCIQACPVDAIVGAAKQMHTIVAPLCTGCELCLPPCPVECIRMEAIPETIHNWKWKHPVIAIKPVSYEEAA